MNETHLFVKSTVMFSNQHARKKGNDIIERTPANPHDCVSKSMSLKMSDHLNFSLQGKVVKCHMHLASQKHGIYDTN